MSGTTEMPGDPVASSRRPSLAEGLPPHIAARISPEWQANEALYWEARGSLLAEYAGQWVAFAGGEVVASGESAVKVLHAAQATGRNPFFTRCGFEDAPASRIRRTSFGYDSSY